jgi:hypothetical protein
MVAKPAERRIDPRMLRVDELEAGAHHAPEIGAGFFEFLWTFVDGDDG